MTYGLAIVPIGPRPLEPGQLYRLSATLQPNQETIGPFVLLVPDYIRERVRKEGTRLSIWLTVDKAFVFRADIQCETRTPEPEPDINTALEGLGKLYRDKVSS